MTLATTIWVAVLHISDATAAKISGLHDFDANEVRLAVQCVSGLRFVWHDDPDRGLRAIVETEIRGIRCLVVLYPVEDGYGDAWNLGSAYPR